MINLPIFFKPKKEYNLIRLGKNNDGGYLVSENSIKNSNKLISMGIKDDWSFERDFCKKNKNIKIYLYDNTLNFIFLIKKFLNEIIKLFLPNKVREFKQSIFNLFDYFLFSKKKLTRININNDNIKEIVNHFGKKIFYKIDIEGSEYEILDQLLMGKQYIQGLVIEFHNFFENIHTIKKFINDLELELTHIHVNNYKPNGILDIIELTFERNPEVIGDKCILPNALDMPNDLRNKDVEIIFY